MPQANDELFDAGNRHQTFLIRFGGSSAREAIKLLNEAEKDLINRIAQRVVRLGPAATATRGSKRLTAILGAIRQQNRDLVNALHKTTAKELKALAKQEIGLASKRLNEAVGVDLENFRPSPEVLRTLVQKRGVGGISLRRWFTRLGRDRLGRLESAVNLGVVEGDGIPEMVRRFRQAEDVSRRSAETLVRTHVNHVANQSRQALYSANSDIVDKLRWTATLDGRTSAICQARDGRTFPLDSGPRPPAHPNCRSIMTPVMKSWDELARPGALKQGRGAADIDRLFQKNLRKQGFTKAEAATIKRNTRASMNGQVPKTKTYQQWLSDQKAEFQDDVLGPTRGKLFRQGGVKLDRFVEEPTGRAFNLDALRRKNAEAFMTIDGPGQIKDLEVVRGTATAGFERAMKGVLNASFAPAVRQLLASKGVRVRLGENMTDVNPSLKGITPRGWPEGTTWENAEGGFDRQSKVVIVGRTRLHTSGSGQVVVSNRTPGVMRHEVGHALNNALDNIVDGSLFRAAYEKDFEAIQRLSDNSKKLVKKQYSYRLPETNPGGYRSETFAELVAELSGGGVSAFNTAKRFPESAKVVRKILDDIK
jgi:SPP1 gp7 family putative phage head morphogenesis protein